MFNYGKAKGRQWWDVREVKRERKVLCWDKFKKKEEKREKDMIKSYNVSVSSKSKEAILYCTFAFVEF